MITLAQVYTGLTNRPAPAGVLRQPVTPWVMNSQLIKPGGGFVARPGAREGSEDGHDYIGDALQRGAAVVIAERTRIDPASFSMKAQVIDLDDPAVEQLTPPVLFVTDDTLATIQQLATWWRNQANPALKVIGITGSVGKTTTKELVSVVLANRFRTWKSRGNYNSDVGLPLTLLDMPLDTERAVVEMGMTRSGEIRELAAVVRPEVGVVTNVGTAHLMQLGSIDAIADAKAELVESLPANGVAILNGDDERVRAMASRTEAQIFTYGLQPEFSLWADQIESHGLDGISFRFHHGRDSVFARLPLLGRHSVHGCLAAASVGLTQGQRWGEIIGGLKDIAKLDVLRVVVVEGVNGSTLLDDTYNASPDSVMAALNLLNDLGGRKIAVLGDMLELGAFSKEGHARVARRAAIVADRFVAVGQMAPLMVDEARDAGLPKDRTFAAADRHEAEKWLQACLQPGDIVLIKGSRALQLDELVTQLSVAGEDV
ncbi:MAG: UDP-N-acetylmuramoyl-tripeptide--D-alanyl-D-alanine ligase [Chloroflexota bacterium]|nr:UDP-N-acetylmuramoyl-tripeptide--D-alanyl-D-alanine ligase [Chloroflexota bacterium]